MEPDLRQSRPLQHPMQHMENTVRGNGPAVGRREDPGAAAYFFSLLFQNAYRILCQRQGAVGVLCFQGCLHHLTVDPGYLPFNPEVAPFQIKILPLQTEKLTTPQAGGQLQIGAAAAPHGTGSYCGLVVVALLTPPPNLPVGAGCHLPGRKIAVFFRMPLGSNGRKLTGQIVFPGRHLPPGADRTATAGHPGGHAGLPLVSLFTDPPDPAGGTRRDLVRGQQSVFGGVPLGGKLRILTGQIIFSRVYFPVGTHGTAAAGHSGFDARPPLMAFFTDPPDDPVTAREHLLWGKGSVAGGVPLTGQIGTAGGQICFPSQWYFPRADRTPGPADGPGMYRCPPAMSLLTLPPYFSLAAMGDDGRCDRQIFVRRPLIQQLLPPFPCAEVMQAFTHGQAPFYAESIF